MRAGAYRIPSLLLGMLTVGMTWFIGTRMRGPGFGLFAGCLAATDGWLFCLSRVGMTDIYLIGTTTAAYAAFYGWWIATSRRPLWMLLVAALCGASLAMKWSAAAPVLGLILLTLTRAAIDWRMSPATRRQTLREAALAAASFAVLLPLIYIASYWAFFAAGHSWSDWLSLHSAILNEQYATVEAAPT